MKRSQHIYHLFVVACIMLITFAASAQQIQNYSIQRLKKFPGETEVLGKMDSLYRAIRTSGVDKDTMLEGFIECYLEYVLPGTEADPKPKDVTPLTDYIHIIDLNHDQKYDLVFDPFNWGCSLMVTYAFINEGTGYRSVFEETGISMAWSTAQDQSHTYTAYYPTPMGADFVVFNTYVLKDTSYSLKEAVHVYEKLIPRLNNKPAIGTTRKQEITIYAGPAVFIKEQDAYETLQLTKAEYKVLETNNKWKLVIVTAKTKWSRHNESPAFYCGWTNEL